MPRIASKHSLVAIVAGLGVVAAGISSALATGNEVAGLDGMIVNNSGGGQSGWGGYGRFSYGAITVGTSANLGRYDSFTIAEPGTGGSGLGVNYSNLNINSPVDGPSNVITPVTSNMFPLLDRAGFGLNFDPNQYVAELVYKPLPGNTATQLNMTLDTTDGFNASGGRAGEQWQWGFFGLLNSYATATLDSDGFATVRSNQGVLSQAAANFHGQSYMYASGNPVGDNVPDFNNFEGGPLPVPNGIQQVQLQTVYGTGQELIDNWEIKALRIVKINADPREIARMDGHSGFSQRFGSPFERNFNGPIKVGGVDYDPLYTDQLSRFDQNGFTNIVINTDDDGEVGGFGLFQAGLAPFDGNKARVEVRARLTVPQGAGEADHIQLVLKDKDGSGTANVGDFGGDEYHYNLALNQFNTSTMTTISIPLSSFTAQQAQEFATPGDGSLSNFNLYNLQVITDQGAGLVDLEMEYFRVMLPGVTGDYDGDSDVDGADLLVWQRSLGSPAPSGPGSGADGNNSGTIDAGDLTVWRGAFGTGASAAAAGAVPEPVTASGLAVLVLGAVAARNRGGRRKDALEGV